MKSDEPIDFSPLDPSRDGQRWRKQLDSVAARALQALPPWSVPQQVFAWFRPTLAIAAAVAALVWVGATIAHLSPRQVREEPAWAKARLVMDGQVPSAWQAVATLGDSDATR
jgi:hypothetical protein